jgi:hypothetical protein
MFKKIILISAGVFLFFGGNIVLANVSINEIMYDLEGTDTNREWIELYNSSETAVDITEDWRFNDGSSHLMNNQEIFSIPANSYIILASNKDTFLSEHVGFLGIVIDTVMNLNNEGDILKILDATGSTIDTITYSSSQGANGDGNSLQLINGVWKSATPTTASQNYNDTSQMSGDNNSNVSTSDSLIQNKIEQTIIKTKIITKNIAFIGIPLEFQANNLGYSGEILNYGRNFWNFGDGDSKEQINNFNKFSHTYLYAGEYTVSLEYYMNYYSEIPDAVNKITIDVVSPSVIISRVGDEKDFFIELKNNSDYEIDISKWILSSLNKTFIFPKNTIISNKSKIILSPKITNFTIGDEKNLKLSTPVGETIFDYGTSTFSKPINNIANPIASIGKLEAVSSEKIKNENETQNFNNNLFAGVIKSEIADKNNSYLFFIGFAILLAVSSGAVYFIRRKKIVLEDGSDFEIIDE